MHLACVFLMACQSERLLVSHANMRCLGRRCPGARQHPQHQTEAGSCPGIGSTSKYAGRYLPGFVRAVLCTVPAFRDSPSQKLVCTGTERECLVAERVSELNEQKKADMLQSLVKLQNNLGHPPNSALIRVLKHGGANQAALDLARDLQCDQCLSQQRPKVTNPAQTHRVTEFNTPRSTLLTTQVASR